MRKGFKIAGISLTIVLIVLLGGFFIYTADSMEPDQTAVALAEDPTQVVYQEGLMVLDCQMKGTTGVVFYPGGKVEPESYLPLLDQLRDQGLTCVLVEMPFNLAVFNQNGAEKAFAARPDITDWILCGHSLGGAMASGFAADHPDQVEGVVLLGAYVYGDWPVEKSLTIYGSEDKVLDRSKIDYDTNVVVIEGGNHANFGNYGEQKGDGTPTISASEQQDLTVEAMMEFIEAL